MMKYLIICLALTLVSCKTYQADELPAKQLIWGSGGGFTGVVNQYVLLENGQVFFQNGLKNSTLAYKKQKKAKAKALFAKCEELQLSKMNIQQAGNLYYFIEYKTEEGTNRITWGAMDYKLNEEIQGLYEELQMIAKESRIIENNKNAQES